MRILHLAYEDPRQPGSGGGSVRTREINRLLGQRHEITCLVTGYPGAKERIEDGVRWIPIGTNSGTKLDRLSYTAALAGAVRGYPHDLVVEDFGAPFSVGLSPLYTRRPVVASVQWLFAREMFEKYHLPFHWIEQAGLNLYRDFIAVSGWLSDVLLLRRPNATVEVIPNGVEDDAFAPVPGAPKHLLFVGRLDVAQKGADFLVEIMTRLVNLLGSRTPQLLVVGDGPDRESVRGLVAQHGLETMVEFRGRVEGPAKYRLMADSHAVLMPSRFETFGMVAVESQAAGAPVVTFDVGPLREVAGGGGARLVPPFDLDAFAAETATLVANPDLADRLRHQGRAWARRYRWADIAARQEAHYLRAVGRAEMGEKEHAA